MDIHVLKLSSKNNNKDLNSTSPSFILEVGKNKQQNKTKNSAQNSDLKLCI